MSNHYKIFHSDILELEKSDVFVFQRYPLVRLADGSRMYCPWPTRFRHSLTKSFNGISTDNLLSPQEWKDASSSGNGYLTPVLPGQLILPVDLSSVSLPNNHKLMYELDFGLIIVHNDIVLKMGLSCNDGIIIQLDCGLNGWSVVAPRVLFEKLHESKIIDRFGLFDFSVTNSEEVKNKQISFYEDLNSHLAMQINFLGLYITEDLKIATGY